ncbi:hypothetical protein TWF730_011356 [Orbilia blumenaviensis]|uniref:Uncharacterized protein n=1 Tax=Orbilia blumenaviensis TaxID=1796055 RepID=A0AAV9UNT0_9PEZI
MWMTAQGAGVFIVFLWLVGYVSAWYQLNVFSDRKDYWEKPLSLRQFGKPPPPMTSTEECRMIARNKARAQMDAVAIWNREMQNIQVKAVAFYAHTDCKRRPRNVKIRTGTGVNPLPLLIIVLDTGGLDGLHITALSEIGIAVNPVAFQSFDIDAELSPGGLLERYAGNDIPGSIFVWNKTMDSYETSDRYRIHYIQPGRWERLGGDTAIFAYMKLETEKILLKAPPDEATQRKIKEFEFVQLGPYLGYQPVAPDINIGGLIEDRIEEPRPRGEERSGRFRSGGRGRGRSRDREEERGGNGEKEEEKINDQIAIEISSTSDGPQTLNKIPILDEQDDTRFFDFQSPPAQSISGLGLRRVDEPDDGNQLQSPQIFNPENFDEQPATLLDLPELFFPEMSTDREAPISNGNIIAEAIQSIFDSRGLIENADQNTQDLLRLTPRLLSSYHLSFDKGKWLAEIVSTTGSVMNKIIQIATSIYNTKGNPDVELGNDGDNLNPNLQGQGQTLQLDDIFGIHDFDISAIDSLGLYNQRNPDTLRDGLGDQVVNRQSQASLQNPGSLDYAVTKRLHTELEAVNLQNKYEAQVEKGTRELGKEASDDGSEDEDYEWTPTQELKDDSKTLKRGRRFQVSSCSYSCTIQSNNHPKRRI